MVLPWVLSLGVAALAASSAQAASTYRLVDTFNSTNFFSEFDFFTQPDPTHGFVNYVDAAAASRDGLAGYSQGGVYLGVDHTNTTTTGRSSVRVTSKKAYTKGLFIADIAHMPAGAMGSNSCGLWPAFWMFGPNWPNSGEIDIIEGVNTQASNAVTLHTGAGCSVSNAGSAPGTKLVSSNCQGNEGCSQQTSASSSYGADFNAAGGGVYVLEWTDTSIKVWFFPRNSTMAAQLSAPSSTLSPPTPNSIRYSSPRFRNSSDSATPDPSTFGSPLAAFAGTSSSSSSSLSSTTISRRNSTPNKRNNKRDNSTTCPIDSHFANHNLVFDTTFCGDWAGAVWAQDQTCSALASTCQDYVGQNPEAFAEAYWLVKGIRVFQVTEQDDGQGEAGGQEEVGSGGSGNGQRDSEGGGQDGQGEGQDQEGGDTGYTQRWRRRAARRSERRRIGEKGTVRWS